MELFDDLARENAIVLAHDQTWAEQCGTAAVLDSFRETNIQIGHLLMQDIEFDSPKVADLLKLSDLLGLQLVRVRRHDSQLPNVA